MIQFENVVKLTPVLSVYIYKLGTVNVVKPVPVLIT